MYKQMRMYKSLLVDCYQCMHISKSLPFVNFASVILDHVYMRPEVNSNWFEISLWDKISLRCEVTSLSAFT